MNGLFRCALATLLVGTVPAFARVSAEQRLRDALVARGYAIGYDEDRAQFLYLGQRRMQVGEGDVGSFLARKRPILARRAELSAKSQLLLALRNRASGGNRLRVNVGPDATKHQTDSVFALFAENTLSGWSVLDSAEVLEDGVYEVAVAVLWSPELEAAGRAAREGRLPPSATWKDECEAWLNEQDLSSWTGTRVFRDSAGFPHLLGIGGAVLIDENPHWKNAARMEADMKARGCLLLGLFGDAEVGRYAASRISSDSEKGIGFDSEAAVMALGNVEVKEKSVMGMMPFYECIVEHPLVKGKMLVVVYGVRPPAAKVSRGVGGSAAGVMIFNPHTGKYEKR